MKVDDVVVCLKFSRQLVSRLESRDRRVDLVSQRGRAMLLQ